MNNYIQQLSTVTLAALLLSSCGSSNKNSERDTKREQTRNYALSKEKELSKIVGNYFGSLSSNSEEIQKVNLMLTVKEEVSTSDNDVDPIRIPRLAGYMRLGYVSDSGSGSHISYSIKKGEYDDKLGSINIELENSKYGLLNLELSKSEDKIVGKWLSPENSADGDISLSKLTDSNIGLTSDFTSTPLDSEFVGFLSRKETSSYHLSKIIFQTQKTDNDSLAITASLILYNGGWSDSEYQKFNFSEVNFNALTGAITMIDESSTISLSGSLKNSNLAGDWSSSYTGNTGHFSLNSKTFNKPDSSLKQELSISRTYFGKLNYAEDATAHFPENISLNLSMREDAEAPFQASITGKVRFYIGSFSSQEYVEVPFSEVDYNTFTRILTIRSEDSYQLTFSAKLENGLVSGDIIYGSLGKIGNFVLSESNRNTAATDMHGQYQAVFTWEGAKAYQLGSLQLLTSYADGITISGNLKLIFGPWHSSEYLTYRFEDIEFNPESSVLTISSSDSEIYLKARYRNGSINGNWFSRTAGRLGGVSIEKIRIPNPPEGFDLLPGISGSYRGKISDTNESTNLPEKTLLNIVASRNTSSDDGVSIKGSIRLYLGEFGSHEYMEYELGDIRHNFYTGEFNATTKEEGLSIKGMIRKEALVGSIFHDGFGEIGSIEVKRD